MGRATWGAEWAAPPGAPSGVAWAARPGAPSGVAWAAPPGASRGPRHLGRRVGCATWGAEWAAPPGAFAAPEGDQPSHAGHLVDSLYPAHEPDRALSQMHDPTVARHFQWHPEARRPPGELRPGPRGPRRSPHCTGRRILTTRLGPGSPNGRIVHPTQGGRGAPPVAHDAARRPRASTRRPRHTPSRRQPGRTPGMAGISGRSSPRSRRWSFRLRGGRGRRPGRRSRWPRPAAGQPGRAPCRGPPPPPRPRRRSAG